MPNILQNVVSVESIQFFCSTYRHHIVSVRYFTQNQPFSMYWKVVTWGGITGKVQMADLTCDVIRKVVLFVLSKLWILVADWSMRWSRDRFLIKLWLYLINPKSKGCLEKAKATKKMVKDVLHLASFYGSHIDGIVCVKQIDLGSARTLKKY